MSSMRQFLATCLIAVLAFSATARAQDDFASALSRTATALTAKQWEQALQSATQGINDFGATSQLYGPVFGHLWYFKGYAELKLRQYEAAAESFKTCYEKFPSARGGVAGAADANGTNAFHKIAILRWAEALQGATNYEEAIKTYEKFLKERDPNSKRDRYNPGSIFINTAICYFRMPQPNFASGIEQFRSALENKTKYRISNGQIMRAYRALLESVIADGAGSEQVLIDFLAVNGPDVRFEPYEAFNYNPIYMKLGNDAFQKSLYRTALVLYGHVPATSVALADVDARIASIAPRLQVVDGATVLNLETLNKIRAQIVEQESSENSNEAIALQAMAAISLRLQSERNAYATYKQLEELFPDNANRESSLYSLVLLGASLGNTLEVEKYGQIFLRRYPDSTHAPTVRRQMLVSLFAEGEYAKCIEVASRMEPTLPEGSEQHDTALYVLAGSKYYEAQFLDAQPDLDRHVRLYPESDYRMNALYFQASNTVRLQQWSRAGQLLDSFLAAYPDAKKNGYLPNALFDRANVHFAEEEYDQALVLLNRIESEFETTPIITVAYNLKGNVLQTQDNVAEAETYYKKAFELAERRKESFVAAEALSYLVALLADQPDRMADALPYYDMFFSDYASGSPYSAGVAVAGLKPMKAANRGDEGLDTLRAVITELSQDTSAPSLEPAINSYTEAYLETHTPAELREHFYSDFSLPTDSARALLRTALISVAEDTLERAESEGDEQQVISSRAEIQVLFSDLKTAFDPSSLTNFTLLKLGDFIREKTDSPLEAATYYEEILGRENQDLRFNALFGMADILARSGTADNADKAISYLDQVIESTDSESDREKAYFLAVEIYHDQQRWDDVIRVGKEYLEADKAGSEKTRRGTRSYTKFASRVTLMVAQAFEAKDDYPNALVTYQNAFVQGGARMDVAVPAYLSWIDLIWEGRVEGASDKQAGYNGFEQYVRLQGNNYSRMSPEDQKLFDTLRAKLAELEASGLIKTYEQQQAEVEQ